MIVATVVAPYASRALNSSRIEAAARALSDAGARHVHETEIEPGIAADLFFDDLEPQTGRTAVLAQLGSVADVIVQPRANRRRRLLIADMDSTMITIECIDELADFAGLKAQVAEVTEAAMRGELDFEQALDARVALLKGLPESALARVYDERLTYTPGARALVQAMAADGAHTVLVSGGFTFFTQKVRSDLGFSFDKSNTLEIEGGTLNGSVTKPIVTAQVKRATLQSEAERLGLSLSACLAVGDGANDIPMIETAGLGVAFRAKPKTKAAAAAHIDHADLTALLFAQGYRLDEFRAWLN